MCRTGAGAPRLPCVKGAVTAVSRKAVTEGLSSAVYPKYSKCSRSDPLSPSVRTGAAPLGQQGEPLVLPLGIPPVTIRFSRSPLAPTLGELAAKPTERVKIALSASGTSPIGRGKFPSSARCGGHLPQRGRLWGTDCDQRESHGHSGNRFRTCRGRCPHRPDGKRVKT